VIRARAGLVRVRTALINTARGLTKCYGERLRGCNACNVNPEKSPGAESGTTGYTGTAAGSCRGAQRTDPRVQPTDRGTGAAQLSASGAAEAGEGGGHADRVDLPAGLGRPPIDSARAVIWAATWDCSPGRRNSGQKRTATVHQQRRRPVSTNAASAGSAPHPGTVWSRQRSAALGTQASRAGERTARSEP
jgi:hypothetical protein